MDIHTMMANAAADVRAMELRIVHLQDEVQRVNLDNGRLRQENAKITAARMHAEADLVHYQNVFVASVCVEAGSICREFFNLTQEKVRERAEGAIQKFVEERQNREREASGVFEDTVEDKDTEEEFDKSTEEGPAKPAEVQDANTIGESYIKPPAGCSFKEAKMFWNRHSTLNRPLRPETLFAGFPISSLRDDSPLLPKNQEPIPSFLTEPKKEEDKGSFTRTLIATLRV